VLKRKTIIRPIKDGDPDMLRVYIKGAPEEIIKLCAKVMDQSGVEKDLDYDWEKNHILEKIVANEMACLGLKVLSFAYKDIHIEDLEAAQ
jgi:magnesium-transporting ATPase (P-type)